MKAILAYHAVESSWEFSAATVRTDRFLDQLAWLKEKGFESVVLSSGMVDSAPSTIAITFDDGYRSIIETVKPAFDRYGWSGTVFVPTSHVGSDGAWDSGASIKHPQMSWSELRALSESGWEIGAHGHSHLDITRMSDEEVAREVDRAKSEIEDRIGTKVRTFSYPFGRFDRRIMEIVAGAGFDFSVTMESRTLSSSDDPLALPRINLHRMDRVANLAQALGGGVVSRGLEGLKSRIINGFAAGTSVAMWGHHAIDSARTYKDG